MRNKLWLAGVVFSISALAMTAEAAEEKGWFQSWGEKIGQKAREGVDMVDPDGSMQEKAKTTYKSSKQYLSENYEAVEGYVAENKEGWKSEGSTAYDSMKESAIEAAGDLKKGAVQGYEKLGSD
ncbi:MAG: hypothetical protein HOG37_02345 [Gammaproteobacteria bacterium]|jgi:hypothetical protein|nr:hypothetical protein [Gammaproteobacteria bacterium]